jgi:hypothetical protein
MKMMKIALIASAAVAAGSLSARADELSDLKAQIEALNSRVATMETASTVPAGYQLLSVSEGTASQIPGLDADRHMGDSATKISILPTADAPASTTVEITGLVRAAIVWDDLQSGDDDLSIRTRGQIVVQGKTDTAVGEVGAKVSMRANEVGFGDPSVISNEQWGYWAVTPELTLGGGYTGSLSGIGYGYDGKCNCYLTDNAAAGYGHGDTTQMRLSYSGGPFGFQIALEDDESTGSDNDDMGVAAEMKFSGDMFSGEISGGYWESDDAWVGIGLGANLDMFAVSVSAGAGYLDDADFWKANILVSANLSDAVHAEVGFNHFNGSDGLADQDAVLVGIYYDPVAQLTVGLEAEHIMNEGSSNDATRVDLVTVYRF